MLDGELVPTELIAETLYVYVIRGSKPLSVYVVEVLLVFDVIVVQDPPLVDRSI